MIKTAILILSTLFLSAFASEETTLLLIRHGETQANVEGITVGWTDVPLNGRGMMQAMDLAEILFKKHPDIAAIYSSDLSRAYRTAEPIATLLEIPIIQRFHLREIYCGDGEGCSQKERERWLSRWNHNWDQPIYPNGEIYLDLIRRMKSELLAIAKLHPGEKVAVFTHGRSIHAITASVLGHTKFPIPENCQVVVFTYNPALENELQWKGIDRD